MQEPSWACGVNNKPCVKLYRGAIPLSFKLHPYAVIREPMKLELIDILDAKFLSLTNQEMVEISPIPMRIRNLVTRASGHEQLVTAFRIGRSRGAEHMMMKGESTLQTTGNVRVSSLPTAPLCERP
jgi:hypothetical protein